jgi:DNA-binding transcriptional LysR family regulator
MAADIGTVGDLGLAAKPVWQEDLELLLPATETEAKTATAVRTRSLAAFAQGCTYRALAEELLDIANVPDWRVQEMGSYHAMIAGVAAGACVTLLPRSVIDLTNIPPGLKTLPGGQVTTFLLWRERYDAPAFDNLLSKLESE